MNVALRAVHEALRARGDPADTWHTLLDELSSRAEGCNALQHEEIDASLRAARVPGSVGEWTANLRLLGVVDTAGKVDLDHGNAVGVALQLVADSFDVPGEAPFWAPVATLPTELRTMLQPPPVRQTAGVLLELVDRAQRSIHLAAPFVDPQGVRFLTESLVAAGRRGVDIDAVTSAGQGARFRELADAWPAAGRGTLSVTEVQTVTSPIGSHAKVLVVDDERGYVGSANLTAAGLGRHVEMGVELGGPHIAELTKLLLALGRAGTRVLTVG